jgi:hypothetical protein
MTRTNPGCNKSTITNIDWTLHHKALNKLPPGNQKTIRQMIHNWLPVNAHKGSAHAISTLCPRCNIAHETQEHFFECHDTRSKASWNTTLASVSNKAHKLAIDPLLIRLITHALDKWRNHKSPDIPEFLPSTYHHLFKEQSKIGWNQITKGRLTLSWVHQQDLYSSNNQGLNKMSTLISTIFTEVYKIWKDRCDIQHGKTQLDIDNKMKHQLEPRVQALYTSRNRLPTIDQLPFDTPIVEILALPLLQLEHWLKRTTKIVKAGLIRARNQDRLNTRPIHFYFPIQPKPQNPTQPTTTPHTQPTPHTGTTTETIAPSATNTSHKHYKIFQHQSQLHPTEYMPP